MYDIILCSQILWTCCLFNLSIYALLKSWLTTTKYLFNRRPWMCSVCRSHNRIRLSHLITNHRMLNKNNTMSVPSESGTAYSPGAPESTPSPWWRLCCSVSYSCFDHCLYLLSFDLRLLLSPLVSSNFFEDVLHVYWK